MALIEVQETKLYPKYDIVWIEKKICAHVSVSLKSVGVSSGDWVESLLGDSGEEGGDVQGSVTLFSRLGFTFKRRVIENGILSCLLGGTHGLLLDIHGFVDTSITWNRSIHALQKFNKNVFEVETVKL